MRLEDIDLWEVYDIKTGRVVIIAGFPYDGMAKHEAEEIVALLESGELTPDTSIRHCLAAQHRQAESSPWRVKKEAELPVDEVIATPAHGKG